MIRLVLVLLWLVGFCLVSTPVLIAQWLYEKVTGKRWERFSLAVVQGVFKVTLWLSGVRLCVRGKEKIPAGQAVLYIGNHRSFFDIICSYSQVPGLTGFMAKKSTGRVPWLAHWMYMVNCLFLDRENVKEGLKTILAAIERIKRGVSVWIYPEGTRQTGPDPTDLLDFKEGSFKVAQKTGCPVVPVAILGTREIFEDHFPAVKPSRVTLWFGEPFYLSELSPEHRKFPGEYTRGVVSGMVGELVRERGKAA
ncbi:MAG: 1-acyl-sn-glycerol-3-phosphate acyltransferase [Lachnospiraceae bacterium]|jgi:1-acyl-sn-glycerol-3-phosphate acyltransferase|nr:1-acyl-sn-glycerol-3-phosphate acyltransferase [Lachnospiraceae bacterium]